MNQKLFELIYVMIVRQELKPQDAYDMLRDFFRLTEISEREKVKELNPEIKEWKQLDLSKWPGQIIDNPSYPLTVGDGITWTGGPVVTTYTNGDGITCTGSPVTTIYTNGANTVTSNTNDQTSITYTSTAATAAAPKED